MTNHTRSHEAVAQPTKQWEYRAEAADVNTLNELGLDGWEAVSVYTTVNNDGYGNKFHEHWALLKRVKP